MVNSGARRAPNYSVVARPGLDLFTPQNFLGLSMFGCLLGPDDLLPGASAFVQGYSLSYLQGSGKGLHVFVTLRYCGFLCPVACSGVHLCHHSSC